MLTKVIGIWGLALLAGCGNKSADSQTATQTTADDARKPSAVAPAGFDSSSAASPVTLPAGTQIRVRLTQAVDTRRSRAGDGITATLNDALMTGEKTIVPRGTEFHGHVTAAGASGRLKGRAVLSVTLDSFELNGKTYRIETSSETRTSKGHKKHNGLMIGGGAGLGAALGAVAGGGAGALIGAGAGAAAGTAGAAATGKENVGFPSETALRFSLKSPIRI